jgi:hypothetical protein
MTCVEFNVPTSYRWLNLLEPAKQVLPPACRVDRVKCFTVAFSGLSSRSHPRASRPISMHWKPFPKFEVYCGNFLPKTMWRPVVASPLANEPIHSQIPAVSLPIGRHIVGGQQQRSLDVVASGFKAPRRSGPPPSDAIKALVHTQEEKGSDVNLGTHLLSDARKGNYAAAAVRRLIGRSPPEWFALR